MHDPKPTWDDLIRDLTRAHKEPVKTDTGIEYKIVEGLLTQLRAEVFGGTDRGATSGNKTKLPLNAPALDLYTLIDRQVAEVWGKASGRVPGVESTETMVALWSAQVGEFAFQVFSYPITKTDEKDHDHVVWLKDEATAYNLAARWVRQIRDLFDPPRQAPIMAACIHCGVREVVRDVDGQKVKSPALMFIRDRQTGDTTEARCQACQTVWFPFQFLLLAELIGKNEKLAAQDVDNIPLGVAETTTV